MVKTWRRQATGSAEGTGRSEAEEPSLSQNGTGRPMQSGRYPLRKGSWTRPVAFGLTVLAGGEPAGDGSADVWIVRTDTGPEF